MAGEIPEARSRLGPAMALVGNEIFFAWRGETSNHVWWTKADLTTGSFNADGLKDLASIDFGPGQAKVDGTLTDFRPALASDRTNLALAWTEPALGMVTVSTFGAGGWSAPIVVPGAFAKEEPAIAIWNSTIHVAWRDRLSGVLLGSYTLGSIFEGAGIFMAPIDLFELGVEVTDVNPPMFGDGTSHAPALASVAAYDGESFAPGSPFQDPTDPYVVLAWRSDQVLSYTYPEDTQGIQLFGPDQPTSSNLWFVSYLYLEDTVASQLSSPLPCSLAGNSESKLPPAIACEDDGVVSAWVEQGKIAFGWSNPEDAGLIIFDALANAITADTPALSWATQVISGSRSSLMLLVAWTQSDNTIHFEYAPFAQAGGGGGYQGAISVSCGPGGCPRTP